MNEVERLIWNHDKTGTAGSFCLTRAELYEITEAARKIGLEEWRHSTSVRYKFM